LSTNRSAGAIFPFKQDNIGQPRLIVLHGKRMC
jgi:hypothetical protein